MFSPMTGGSLCGMTRYWKSFNKPERAKITDGFTDAEGKQRQPGFHHLRRTFARMANRAGVAHSHIMEIAGWKS